MNRQLKGILEKRQDLHVAAKEYLPIFKMTDLEIDYMGLNQGFIRCQRDQYIQKHKVFKKAEKENEDKIKNLRLRVRRRISFDGTEQELLTTSLQSGPRKAVQAKTGLDAEKLRMNLLLNIPKLE